MAEFTIELKSKGADIIEKQINDLAKSAAATGRSVVQLSKALGTSGEESIEFAKDLGVSTAQASKLVKGFQDLEKTGLSLDQIFEILQKETGLTSKQFNSLSSALVSVDDQAQQSIGNIDGFAQSLGDAFTKAKQPIEGFAKDLQDATNEVLDFRNSIQTIPESVDVDISGIADSVGQSNLALETLSRGLGTSNEETKKIIVSVSNFNAELRNIASVTGKTEQEVSTLVDEFRDGISATNALANALDTSADVAEKLGLEAAQDADSLQALANVLGRTTEEVLDLSSRIERGVASFGILIDDVDKAGLSLADFTRDLEKAEFTIATLSVAIDKSEDEIKTLIKSFNNGEATLTEFARSLGVTEAEAEQLITAFRSAQYDTNVLSRAVDDLAKSYNVVQKAISNTDDVVSSTDGNVDRLTESVNNLDDSIENLGDSTEDTAKSIEEGFELIAEISGASLAALTLASGEAVKSFSEFDRQIRQSGVISGATDEELALLRDTVIDLGIVTSATPKDIAALTNSLSRAGFTANEQVSALEGIIRASEATGESLEGIGGIIGQITKSFQLSSAETERVADVLVSAANSTNTSVVDLGEGFAYVGAQAVQTNQPIEEIASALGLLADAGLEGSLGGTSLNEALRRLSLASAGANTEFNDLVRGQKKMTQAFTELEADIRDANGQLLPLSDILVILKGRFDELETQEDREVLANALFGAQGGRAFLGLMAQSEDRVNSVNEAVRNSGGIAKRSGEELLEGLGGAFTLLGSSVDTLLIEIGDFLANGVEPLVRSATGLLNAFLALPAPVKNIVFALGGVTTALTAAVFVMSAYQALQIKAKFESIALAATRLKESIANFKLAASLETVSAAALRTNKALLSTKIAGGQAAAGAAAAGSAAAGAGTAASGAASGTAVATVGLGAALKKFGGTVLKLAPQIALVTAAIGSATLGFKTWETATGPAGKVKDSINDINKALDDYTKKTGISLVKIEETKGRFGQISEQASKLAKNLAIAAANFKLLELGSSASESAARGLIIRSADLNQGLQALNDQYLKFRQANQLGSEAALELITPLEIQRDAYEQLYNAAVANGNVGVDQLTVYKNNIDSIDQMIGSLRAAAAANEQQGDAATQQAQANVQAAAKIQEAYDNVAVGITQSFREIDNAVAEETLRINEKLAGNAEARELAIARAESQGIDKRIKAIEGFIRERKALSGLTVENEKNNIAEIEKLEDELTSLRLKKSEERIKVAEDEAEAILIRQQSLDELRIRSQELVTENVINSNKLVLESLEDQTDEIDRQLKLLEVQQSTQESISDAKIQAISDEISSLESAQELVKQIAEGELNRNETLLAQGELRRLGLSAQASEPEIIDAITRKQEEQRQLELAALEERQANELKSLELKQKQEEIDLNRQITQSNIAAIEAQSLITQALITLESDKRLLSLKEQELSAARLEGIPKSELLALQAEIEAQKTKIALKEKAEIPLLEQSAFFAEEQLKDAIAAKEAAQELFDAQRSQLETVQQIESGQQISEAQQARFEGNLQRAGAGLSPLVQRAKTVRQPLSITETPGNVVSLTPTPGISSQLLAAPSLPSAIVPQAIPLDISPVKPELNRIEFLLTQLVNAPRMGSVNSTANFYNQPNPLQTQIEFLQGQMRAARGAL